MRWKLRAPVDRSEWRTWFAWYPVKVTEVGAAAEWVWLEWVLRRFADEEIPVPGDGPPSSNWIPPRWQYQTLPRSTMGPPG